MLIDAGNDESIHRHPDMLRRTELLHAVFVDEPVQFLEKHVDVLELPVHGRKPDVRHLVYGIQELHQNLADHTAFDFGNRRVAHFSLDIGNNDLELAHRHGTFLTGAKKAAENFVTAEFFPAAVLLNDDKRSFLDRLESGEPPAALLAFPAATD